MFFLHFVFTIKTDFDGLVLCVIQAKQEITKYEVLCITIAVAAAAAGTHAAGNHTAGNHAVAGALVADLVAAAEDNRTEPVASYHNRRMGGLGKVVVVARRRMGIPASGTVHTKCYKDGGNAGQYFRIFTFL
jgi:hypothetical protein